MAKAKIENVKDAAKLATFIREEDLEDMEKLSRQITDLAHQAREDGRVYLLQQYIRLSAVINPEIERVEKRFKRENLAFLRKEEKRIKQELKDDPNAYSADKDDNQDEA